ncbi:hypothetical protein [Deinococcus arenicola]|uniref:DUF3108 domain-containing protein n=1 Tax=Deinococcus arenicola TaxID=2994950 RepID=A0ABU4DMV2_9DEIO|nr:hypothetical protein [Deinococcus sp. ZS9-10]MDV6373764.1 hypothetical protein [Deinococcus sp. ZS9-10]
MRKPTLLTALFISLPLLSGPALAWVPQLEETTAKNVIDGAYGRRAPVTTFLSVNLGVKAGQFVAGPNAVTAYMGGPACVDGWLADPTDTTGGSRPTAITASGQADQLFFQAQDARDSFKNLNVTEALSEEYATQRLANGELRVDVAVAGLPTELARNAYLVRMKSKDGKLVAPVRSTYVNDFKQDGATWTGTLVYYFAPLKAGLGAGAKAELLIKTEADTECAYSVPLDLGKFQ